MRSWLVGLLALAATGATTPAPADERPCVALVLSGGGARGAAHVGVLEVLEELRVPVDLVVGTSMGAIVGGLHAAGHEPREIRDALVSVDWADALSDAGHRRALTFRRKRDADTFLVDGRLGLNRGRIQVPPAVVQGQALQLLLSRELLPVAGAAHFDDLPLRFRAVATDLSSGEAVVLEDGPLPRALRASMAVPTVFAPVRWDDRLLVDGGVSNNLPIDVARELGADVVIAVDVSTPLMETEEITSAVDVAVQLTNLLTRAHAERQLALLAADDVLIAPDLGAVSSTAFGRVDEAIRQGRLAASAAAGELARLSVSEAEHARRRRALGRPLAPAPTVAEVTVTHDARVDDAVVRATVRQAAGEPLRLDRLDADVWRLHGLGLFESVEYRVEPGAGGEDVSLVVDARRRAWGPGYLQLGVAVHSDFAGRNAFQVGAAWLRTELNRLNGEARALVQAGEDSLFLVELHQPLDARLRWFLRPAAWYEVEKLGVYEADREVAELRVAEWGGGVDFGRELGRWGELRLGVRRTWGHADRLVGERPPPTEDFQAGVAFARLEIDTLDDPYFPGRGVSGAVEWRLAREGLGAERDAEYDLLSARVLGAGSWGAHSLIGSVRLTRTTEGTLPVQDLLGLGGFLNLSGFDADQLRGQHDGLARLVYLRRLHGGRWFVSRAGFSIEAGNVWNDFADAALDDLRLAGSVFVGVDTPLGPVHVGLGLAEGGHGSAYLFLGRTF